MLECLNCGDAWDGLGNCPTCGSEDVSMHQAHPDLEGSGPAGEEEDESWAPQSEYNAGVDEWLR